MGFGYKSDITPRIKKTAIKTDLRLRFKVNMGKGIFDKGYHNIRNNFLEIVYR